MDGNLWFSMTATFYSNTCELVRSYAIAVRHQSSSTLCKYFSDSKLCLNIRYVRNIGLSSELISFFQSFRKCSVTLDLHWDLNEVKFPCRTIPYNFVNSVTLVTHVLKPCRCKLSSSLTTDILLLLSIGTLTTNFSEILSEMYTFSFKKMHLKMSSAKWRPLCFGLSVLTVLLQLFAKRCLNGTCPYF